MSYNNSNTFRLSNEQLLLVNILNTMYNDNLRHINSITETLNSLVDSNNQIRTSLSQILNTNQNTSSNNSRRNNRRWENTTNSLGRIMLNNIPYVIESVNEYTIPRNRGSNSSEELFTQIFDNFLQPVEVYPTQSQIETSTRRVRYCDIARPINTSCPISMEDFEDNDMVTIIRHCGHTFHTDNLLNWFRTNSRCPVCRYDIREYNPGLPSQFSSSQTTATDSSYNNVERNNHNTSTVNLTGNNSLNSLEDIFNISGLMDTSGNYTNSSTDSIAMFLFNALNRNRNTR